MSTRIECEPKLWCYPDGIGCRRIPGKRICRKIFCYPDGICLVRKTWEDDDPPPKEPPDDTGHITPAP